MKVQLLCLLLFYLACSKNIPLQLEIGLIQFENLEPGKLQYQEIKFDQPFIRVPQVALTINQALTHNEQVYFSKIYNISTDGFRIGVLSGTEQNLEYRYMAIVDDRVQINCLNFKVKEFVFLPYLKQFVKTPKSMLFLTGIRQTSNDLVFQQDIRNEGVMIKLQSQDVQILGVCLVSGAIDILQSKQDELPTFNGFNLQKQQIALSVIAQASFICEDECSLYFRNEQSKQQKINTQFQNKNDKFSKFLNFKKESDVQTIEKKEEEVKKEEVIEKQEKIEQNIQQKIVEQIEEHNQMKVENPKEIISPTHEQSLKSLISKSIQTLEEQINHPNGENSFDSNTKESETKENKNNEAEDLNINQKIEDSISESDSEDEFEEANQTRMQHPINIEEELRKLEKISEDRTKKVNIIEFRPKESVNVSLISKQSFEIQEETQGEKLIELKYIDRAPKLSPKLQSMIEEAKKNIEQDNQEQTKNEESPLQILRQKLNQKKESLIQQIENTSHFLSEQQQASQSEDSESENEEELKQEQQIIEEQPKKVETKKEKQMLNEYDTIFAQFANNNNLRQNKPKAQQFSSPLIDAEIQLDFIEEKQEEKHEPIVEKPLNPREERLQKYLKKADEVDLNFLENIKLVSEGSSEDEEPLSEQSTLNEQEISTDQLSQSYTEQLNQRKNQILQELQQKYNVKAQPDQSFEEFKLKMPTDQYPQILYEKYIEQLKKQQVGVSLIETDHNVKSVESSYQLEAAYYEWQLQKKL